MRLPGAEDLGARPVPSGRGAPVSLNLSTPRPSGEFEAAAQLGSELDQLGGVLNELFVREQIKNDKARTEEAYNTYLNGQMDLEYGDAGFTTYQGGAAANGSLLDKFRKQRENLANQIANDLENPEQVELFRAQISVADRQFDTRVYKHVANESKVYRQQTFEGGLETERHNAALNWEQPGQIELSVLRTNQLIMQQAAEAGLNPDDPGDAKLLETQQRIAESQIHASVIDQMLLRGQDVAAKAYYSSLVDDDRLTPESAVTIGAKLQTVGEVNSVIRGVDLIWETSGPKTPNDPVRTDIMGQQIRQLFANQPSLAEDAIKEMNARAKQHNDSQKEVTDSNKASVISNFRQGASLLEVQQSAEFIALDGATQAETVEYLRGLQAGEQTRNNYALYTKLSDPFTLRHMSINTIASMEPQLGPELTQRLLDKRSKYDEPIDYQEATMDEDSFKAIAAEVFRGEIDPYKSADQQSSEALERMGRLRSQVETRIEVEEAIKRRDTGKGLTMEEKEEIMRKVADQRIMETAGFNTDIPAVTATAEERRDNDLIVPIEQVQRENPQWLNLAINIMRSEGVIPLEWTDEEALTHFRKRFEKAYAHSLTGGDESQGMEILTNSDTRRPTLRSR